MSLKYTPMLSGIKEEILLETHVDLQVYSFLLKTDGLFLNEVEGQYFLSESSQSKDIKDAVLYLGEIILYDAIGKPGEGDLNIKTIEDGMCYLLTISADEFLSDPETVYPVTIDPSLTYSDTDNGANTIEDCPIFSGKPTRNYANYIYLTAGYTDDTYKIGRIAIRLPGLYNSEDYKLIGTANSITSAKFYCRDSSGRADQYINLYRCTGSWSESTLTWDNFSGYSTSINWGTSMKKSGWTDFDITSLVKYWKMGIYSAEAGFVLVNSNESSITYKKAPFSSEYSNVDYRPYVVLTYVQDISLSKSSLTMNVGETTRVSTSCTPTSAIVSWSSSNPRIATVNANGEITAKGCGKISITAYITGSPSIKANLTLTVNPPTTPTFNITSGCVYMIRNVSKNQYLTAGKSSLTLSEKNVMDGKQLWYVVWTGNGYSLYSMGVRNDFSYGRFESVLRGATATNSPTLALESASYQTWAIHRYPVYVYLTNTQYGTNTSLTANSSNSTVTCEKLSDETEYARWMFEKIETSTFNNYADGRYTGQSGTVYIKVNVDSSVYENDYVKASYFDVLDEWKNLSSKVVIYNRNDTVPEGVNPIYVTFEGYTPSGAGDGLSLPITTRYAETVGQSKYNYYKDFDDDWYKIKIMINISGLSPFKTDSSEVLVKKVLLHEFGHALKLLHLKASDNEVADVMSVPSGRGWYPRIDSICSVMNQGSPTSIPVSANTVNNTAATPKWHDIINLRNKWGA